MLLCKHREHMRAPVGRTQPVLCNDAGGGGGRGRVNGDSRKNETGHHSFKSDSETN